ncbi:MAG: hypothetical protein ACR2F1_02675 [Nitrososphaeraceae archaeon]
MTSSVISLVSVPAPETPEKKMQQMVEQAEKKEKEGEGEGEGEGDTTK